MHSQGVDYSALSQGVDYNYALSQGVDYNALSQGASSKLKPPVMEDRRTSFAVSII